MVDVLGSDLLPSGIRARFVNDVNGLRVHLLEAGQPERPCVLLLHGFPELAYSWRKVMPAVAAAGFYVIAPDQRGYGRTTGWDPDYDGDLASFRPINLVRDVVGLLAALGRDSVAAVVGHDFGASVSAWCALLRPDLFRSLVLMSAPFGGLPSLAPATGPDLHVALAGLERPRKHYQWYYSTREANADMMRSQPGIHGFLRAYYHHKSADWSGNQPFRLASGAASELARMPTYYIMDLDRDMPRTVAAEMPSPAAIADCRWLPEAELRVYSGEYKRTGFQGGLQWYRCRTQGIGNAEMQVFIGRTIDIPSLFIAGAHDWGIYQTFGAIDRMQTDVCTQMLDCHLINGAGHWVQQEDSAGVTAVLMKFLCR
ncbi:alpha/beta fold hydrolase [Rhodopila sp.]|uniref:alpha/beta fold hydrolase n=1 Tax=Rhodopila sp. TaxID=2480087 RepID=UPI003D0CAC78